MFNLTKLNSTQETDCNSCGIAVSAQLTSVAPSAPISNDPATQSTAGQTLQQFPVKDAADLASKFMDKLLSPDYNVYASAMSYVLQQVKGEIQEQDIKGILEAFWNLEYNQQGEALQLFNSLYQMLPAKLRTSPNPKGTTAMSENPKGIVKYNLSDFVLNNQKTAAAHFGHEYLLYGPTEKRICPKLSGKGIDSTVSEYICRHHCLDGIVIDDNKTICGEALWRANVMDKFSREYVDADGNTVGGYINKRFEVNRNVPEENRMRLKPGELRKPRPANMGNLESRMQDMRNKEGEKRGYKPNTDTTKPFNWAKDVDQNNVNVAQSTRDQREENSGHETVDHVSEKNMENNPKVASFNMAKFKTAQMTGPRGPFGPDNPQSDDLGLSPDIHDFDDQEPAMSVNSNSEQLMEEYLSVVEEATDQMQIDQALQRAKEDMGTGALTPHHLDEISTAALNRKTSLQSGQGGEGLFEDPTIASVNKDNYQYKFAQVYETGAHMGSDADIPENAGQQPPMQEENNMQADGAVCPVCQGEGAPLGQLGNLTHYRCRSCGMDFQGPATNHLANQYSVNFTKLAEDADTLKKK